VPPGHPGPTSGGSVSLEFTPQTHPRHTRAFCLRPGWIAYGTNPDAPSFDRDPHCVSGDSRERNHEMGACQHLSHIAIEDLRRQAQIDLIKAWGSSLRPGVSNRYLDIVGRSGDLNIGASEACAEQGEVYGPSIGCRKGNRYGLTGRAIVVASEYREVVLAAVRLDADGSGNGDSGVGGTSQQPKNSRRISVYPHAADIAGVAACDKTESGIASGCARGNLEINLTG